MSLDQKEATRKRYASEGILFPSLHSRSLARTPVHLPDDARGLVTLILVAFQRQAQSMVDSWLDPYMEKFDRASTHTFYEIPMIKGKWWRLFSPSIDGGMRMGIPQEKHEHVITYYGNIDPYLSVLGIQDLSLAYAFLLDTKGYIAWQGKGFATPQKLQNMLNKATQLSSFILSQ